MDNFSSILLTTAAAVTCNKFLHFTAITLPQGDSRGEKRLFFIYVCSLYSSVHNVLATRHWAKWTGGHLLLNQQHLLTLETSGAVWQRGIQKKTCRLCLLKCTGSSPMDNISFGPVFLNRLQYFQPIFLKGVTVLDPAPI